jgi:hypothetical protein
MKTLVILDYDRHELGRIVRTPDGRLELEICDNKYTSGLLELVCLANREPLPVRSYEKVQLTNEVRWETRVHHLTPAHPDFLWAVKEFVNKKEVDGTPIVSYIVETSATSAKESVTASGAR